MTNQHRFLVALRALQDWHADSVKARDYNAAASSSASKPGSVHLRVQRYPKTREWIVRFMAAPTPDAQLVVVEAVEAEFERIGRRESMRRCVDFWRNVKWHPASETCSVCG